jgi:triacylglycerol lipase
VGLRRDRRSGTVATTAAATTVTTTAATTANRALDAGIRVLDTPVVLRGMALEAAWIAAHLAIYPAGLMSRRVRDLDDPYTTARMRPLPRGMIVRDVEAAGVPILLLHGLIDNQSIFARLRGSLRRRGFGRVVTVNLPLFLTDIPAAAERLAATVDELCQRTGYPRIHIVAHSLGGLVARYYAQVLGGDAHVDTLVTLGTPHGGTRAARLLPRIVPYPLVAQLRPGSALLGELAAPAPGCRTRFVCFAAELDRLVLPRSAALMDHPDLDVRNISVPGTGHHALTVNGHVVHEIATTLARREPGPGQGCRAT